MADLFTTFEQVTPPDIITPEVQQNYQEIQSILNDKQDFTIDNSINDYFTDDDLEKPDFLPFYKREEISPIQKVIDTARSFVGSKYSWGGSSPSTGFDCSGLLQYSFKAAGIDLPRVAAQQGKIGQEIDIKQAQPGDIIWFGSKSSPSGQHIGLVSKIDNDQIYIIDAAGKKLGVTERPLPNLQIKSVRRIFGENFNSKVINFFMNKGLTENQARGILGNLLQESNGNPNAMNKTSGAYGIAQWLGDRKKNLFYRYNNAPTLDQQLEYIWEELNLNEKPALEKLLQTDTIAEATRVFANHYERAGKNEMNINRRIQLAYQAV